MKQIINYQISVLLFIATVFTGCLDSNDNSGFEVTTPEITLSTASITVPLEGADETVYLTSNLPWRLKTEASWITFPTPNGDGSSEVIISVARNRTTEWRTATVTAYITDDSQAEIEVTQEPAEETNTTYYVKTDGDAMASGLTWEEATTLATALKEAGNSDHICVAAGTYTPVGLLPGGNSEQERTFEIHSNMTIEGGYPADAQEGATPDPMVNETIFSGNVGEVSAYHVVTVSAEEHASYRVVLKNLTITGGVGYSTYNELNHVVNKINVDASMGGGLCVVGSNLDVINCRITDNEAFHSGGVHIHAGSDVRFEDCTISDNTAAANGGGIWNSGGVVYMNGCTISGNASAQQAAGYYSIGSGNAKSISRIYNSTFADNDNTRINTGRSGGGAYIREDSDAVFVNCTFSGNKAGYGGGISCYGSAARPAATVCISCTFTANTANDGGGGLFIYNANARITAYNSIISGNTGPAGSVDTGVLSGVSASLLQTLTSIDGSQLLNASGNTVGGWNFDASSMLGQFGFHNGGVTRTYPLVVSASNPAVDQGLDATQLQQLAQSFSPALDEDILAADQNDAARTGSSIGATTVQ